MKYIMVVVEEGSTSWGAYAPDLPGCAAAGQSREAVLQLIQESIGFHLGGFEEKGELLPSHSSSELVEARVAQPGGF